MPDGDADRAERTALPGHDTAQLEPASMSRAGYDARAKESSDYVAGSPFPSLLLTRPSNTRDQLRGVHDPTLVHADRADHGASTRLQPPLVSCIALLGGTPHLRACLLRLKIRPNGSLT